ncbi:MAG: SurA N-terminal domain-containing protein [Treponema sp.]|nr:SurA N-terminal domain-containing protein [Treponema sp.]
MKRIFVAILALLMAGAVFAQSDLQVLASVKYNKTESITVKQLKSRVSLYEKQQGASLSTENRKKVLDSLIQEKLILQAAAKSGLTIPDSQVDQMFLQQVCQQLVGRLLTQSELEQLVKQQTNLSLDEFMKQQIGMSVEEYKVFLKNQTIAQQYIVGKYKNELQQVSPSDDEIRAFYELNKTTFVWSDMFKMFLVIVPKGNNAEAARVKADGLYKQLKDKKVTTNQLTVDSKKENSGFQAGEVLVNKSAQSAQQLGISYNDLLGLFSNDKGYISNIVEQDTNFQFFTILKKYEAKMLSLSDVVQPETTNTVYDYIKQSLGQQKQMEYLSTKVQEVADSLDTPANVERKKTGAELDKLLNW